MRRVKRFSDLTKPTQLAIKSLVAIAVVMIIVGILVDTGYLEPNSIINMAITYLFGLNAIAVVVLHAFTKPAVKESEKVEK